MGKTVHMKERAKKMRFLGPAVVLLFMLLLPLLSNSNYFLFLMLQVFINIIIVMGLNIITGLTGQMHFGTGAIFSLGAYTSAIVTTKLGVSPWIGLLCAIVMGLIVGIGLGYPGLKVRGVYLWLITIAFNQVVNLLERNMVNLTGGTQGIRGIPYFSLFGKEFSGSREIYYLYLAFTVFVIYLAWRICHSRFGRSFRAIRDNEDSMSANGIDIAQKKILAFIISTVFACFAGSLYAHCYNYITPNAFADLSTNYLVMMMVGGIGSIPGCAIGAAVITLLPEYMRALQQYYWLIFSVITLLMTIFTPKGLISIITGDFEDSALGKIQYKVRKGGRVNGGHDTEA